MQQPTSGRRRLYTLWSAVFGALLLSAALYALLGDGLPAAAHGKPPFGTVPPITRFDAGISPNPAARGDLVTVMVQFVTTDPAYRNVTLGITGVLPAGIEIVDMLTPTVGYVYLLDVHNIVWLGSLEQPQTVQITLLARVNTTVCEPLTSRFTLSEIDNPGAGGPTDKTITTETQLEIGGCSLYLPAVQREMERIPQFTNWDFEAGPVGWEQVDNDAPARLIYSTVANNLPMPHGGKWFGWLAGLPNKVSTISQSIHIPAGHSGLELRFLYWIASDGACGLNLDVGAVLLNGQEIADAPFLLCRLNNTGGWRTARILIPPQYEDTTVYVSLRSRTDGFQNSNWYIDNVRLCSTDPRAAAADRCQ